MVASPKSEILDQSPTYFSPELVMKMSFKWV